MGAVFGPTRFSLTRISIWDLVADRNPYTLARKDYIHKVLFSELISGNITFQLQENILRELISRKLHITYSFVIQRITWKNCLGIISLENLISVTCNNVFGINFAIISGWSVLRKSRVGWGSKYDPHTMETWCSWLREWKSWKLQQEQFLPRQQVLLGKNFHSRPALTTHTALIKGAPYLRAQSFAPFIKGAGPKKTL